MSGHQTASESLPELLATHIPLYKIEEPEVQLRPSLDTPEMLELIESIRVNGVIQPILLRPKGDHYQVVYGYRRFYASKKLGLPSIPATIRPVDDKQAIILGMTENSHRMDDDPILGAERLQELRLKFHLSDSDIAKSLGRTPQWVKDRLAMLQLAPSIRHAVSERALTIGNSLELLRIQDSILRETAAAEAIRGQPTRQQFSYFVGQLLLMSERMRGAPPEAVVDATPREPEVECHWCHILVKISQSVTFNLCEQCRRKLIYLEERYKREPRNTPQITPPAETPQEI